MLQNPQDGNSFTIYDMGSSVAGANALGNAFAIYELRFIDNVRLVQIFCIVNGYRGFLRAIIMMIADYHDF